MLVRDDLATEPRPEPFLALVPTQQFDSAAAAGFVAVMAQLPKPKGRTYDRQIAGHALSLGLPVVTSDFRGFTDVEGLVVTLRTK